MAVQLEKRPTLLVGVGGTGAMIAERILKEVRANDDTLGAAVRMLAVDTDEGAFDKLPDLPKENRLQISRPETVRVTLARNPDVQSTWCYSINDPAMTEKIKNRSLVKGAGQMRMLTRLALHDGIRHGDLMAKLENAIARLAVHRDRSEFTGGVQVIMVGSFGGATGSGSFLQLALALRHAGANRGVLPSIRGIFLLPDIFIRSGVVSSGEWENLLSNGYASMKELNALTLRGNLREMDHDFEFEFVPGQFADTGTEPFDEVSFIDFENSLGESMGRDVDPYVDMAMRYVHMSVFTPLGPVIASQAINRLREQQGGIAEREMNVFSGVGVAGIEYPVDSVRMFLARRLVLENLKGDWTRLDVAFREKLERHKQDTRAGATSGDAPEKAASFLKDFDDLAGDESASPFFRRARASIYPVIEDKVNFTKSETPLHMAYVDGLLDYTRRQFWAEGEMTRIRARRPMEESALVESDSIVDTVRQEEYLIDRDHAAIEAALAQRPVDVFQNTLISADSAGAEEWGPHHLQTYVIRGGLHPVAVRAFLYLVQAEMSARLDDLRPQDTRRSLFRLADRFRSDDEIQAGGRNPPRRGTSSVLQKAEAVSGGGPMGRLFNRKKKAFAEDYATYNDSTLRLMEAYADQTVAAKVLDRALAEVASLVRVYEGLFTEIEGIAKDLAEKNETDVARFDTRGGVFTGNTFVYADAACREDVWQRLQAATAGLTMDEDVNRELNQAVFRQHRSDRRTRTPTAFSELRNAFHNTVVIGFGRTVVERDYRSVYDLNVIEAMHRQHEVETAAAQAAGMDDRLTREQYVKTLVDNTSRQSLPYVSLTRPDSDGTGVKIWALHPDCRDAIPGDTERQDLFQSETSGENAVVAPQFSRHKLVCANLRVNLRLQNLSKLAVARGATDYADAGTDGRMTAAYNATLARMFDPARADREGAEFTPHVDKTWHLPGALPELHAELDKRIMGDKAKAYVAARALGLIHLEVDERHNLRMARIATHGYGVRDGVDDVIAESHDPWAVYNGMTGHVGATRSALSIWERKLQAPAAAGAPHGLRDALLDPATLMTLFAPAQVRNDAVRERDAAVRSLAVAWIGMVGDLIEAQEAHLSERARKTKAQETVRAAQEGFFAHVREEQLSAEVMRSFDSLFAQASDSVFAS
jgi:hypothetical protein